MNLERPVRVQGRAETRGTGPRRRTALALVYLFALSALSLPLHLLLESHGHAWELPGVSLSEEHHEDHHSDPGEDSSGHSPHWAADHAVDAAVVRSDHPADDVLAADPFEPRPFPPDPPRARLRRRIESSSPSPPLILRASASRAPPSF